jgi:hypothetical protein
MGAQVVEIQMEKPEKCHPKVAKINYILKSRQATLTLIRNAQQVIDWLTPQMTTIQTTSK